jgi:putative acetyltransferase
MLVRLSLTVFADNEKAIRLYEKFGFEKEGRLRKAAIRAGKYEDEWAMGRVRE